MSELEKKVRELVFYYERWSVHGVLDLLMPCINARFLMHVSKKLLERLRKGKIDCTETIASTHL